MLRVFSLAAVVFAVALSGVFLAGTRGLAQADEGPRPPPAPGQPPPAVSPEGGVRVAEASAPGARAPTAGVPQARGRGRLRVGVEEAGAPVPAVLTLRATSGGEGPSVHVEDVRHMAWDPLLYAPLRDVALVEAGASGHVFTGLEEGWYEVEASVAGRSTIARVLLHEHREARLVLALVHGPCELNGVVVFPDGRPFRGRVVVTRGGLARDSIRGKTLPGVMRWAPRITRTQSDGHFVVSALPAGPFVVSVVLPWTVHEMICPLRLPYKETLRIVVPVKEVAFEGRVLDVQTEQPIANAWVAPGRVAQPGRGGVRTDAHGRFRLVTVLPPRMLAASAPGYVTTTVPARRDQTFTIRIARAGVVTGAALDETTGEPVVGARVTLARVGVSPRRQYTFPTTITGPRGRYRFDQVSPGPVLVFATVAGRVSRSLLLRSFEGAHPYVRLMRPGQSRQITLIMGPAQVLDVCARSPDGKAVVDAQVLAAQPDAEFGPGSGGRLEFYEHWYVDKRVYRTDAQGCCRLDELVPGAGYYVRVWKDDHRGDGRRISPLHPQEGPVVIELCPHLRRRVRIVDTVTGAPVQGARLGGVSRRGRSLPLDDEVFLAPARRGRAPYWVVSAPGYQWAYGHIVQGAQGGGSPFLDDGTTLTVRMTPGRTIHGRIVAAKPLPMDRRWLWGSQGGARFRFTNAAGHFEVTDVGNQEMTIGAEVQTPDALWKGTVVVEPGADDIVIHLAGVSRSVFAREQTEPPEPRVAILTPRGEPLLGGRVHLLAERRWLGDHPIEFGTFQVPPKALTGEVQAQMIVMPQPPPPGAPARGGMALVRLPRIDSGDATVTLPAEQTLQGSLVDQGGRGIVGAQLRLHPVRPLGSERYLSDGRYPWALGGVSTWTDAQGRFLFRGLGDFEYALRMALPEGFPRALVRRVQPSSEPLRIEMPTQVRHRLRVLDARGEPLSGADVSLYGTPGFATYSRELAQAVTDAQGFAVLKGFDPDGRFDLYVSRRHPLGRADYTGRDIVSHARIEGWTRAQTTIHGEARHDFRGLVVDEKGRAIPDALIWVLSPKGKWGRDGRSDKRGRFHLLGKERARLVVVATESSGGRDIRPLGKGATLEAGETRGRLLVEPYPKR